MDVSEAGSRHLLMIKVTLKTEKAVGKSLCHDITKVVRGAFKKGHVICQHDLEGLFYPCLRVLRLSPLFLW